MYANLKDGLEVNGLSSLLMTPLELQYTAPVLMNNYRSPLVLYGTGPNVKNLMGPLGGSSERTNVISQRAIIDSGADLHT